MPTANPVYEAEGVALYLADCRAMAFLEDGSVDIVPKYIELAKRRLQSRVPEPESVNGETVDQMQMWEERK